MAVRTQTLARGAGKYGAVLDVTLSTQLAYGRDVLARALFMLVLMVVFTQLWITTYGAAAPASGTLSGLSLAAVVWYVVVTEGTTLSAPRVSQTIDQEVRSGDVAVALLRPYHYLLYRLAAYWGEALVRLPVNLAVGGLVALLTVGPPPISLLSALAALLTGALGLTLNFAGEAAIGLLAFWVEDTLPFYWVYQKLQLTIGGTMLPLEFFPGWLVSVARLLPFAAGIYAPAHLLVSFSWAGLAGLLALQLAWLAVSAAGLGWVYGRAMRRVHTHGG